MREDMFVPMCVFSFENVYVFDRKLIRNFFFFNLIRGRRLDADYMS